MSLLNEQLGIDVSFDVILREIRVGSKDAALLFLDGFVHDLATQQVISSLMEVKPQELAPKLSNGFWKNIFPILKPLPSVTLTNLSTLFYLVP